MKLELKYKLCRLCGQPLKPKDLKPKPGEFEHATGCPYTRKRGAYQRKK